MSTAIEAKERILTEIEYPFWWCSTHLTTIYKVQVEIGRTQLHDVSVLFYWDKIIHVFARNGNQF